MSSTNEERKPVAIEVQELRKEYSGVTVLDGINLSVKPGEIFVIMGPSGSGKSVLLRQVAGLETPTSGQVRIDGMDPSLEETRDKVALALVFQSGALFNSLSVFENLALYLREHRLHPEPVIREKVMSALQMLSLEKAVGKFPSELSGGMKKRVAIARALVMQPQVMLYDEPTSELDPTMGATIAEIIASLRQAIAVTSVVVSHDRDLALTIADRVAVLMHGRLKAEGTPAGLRANTDPEIVDFLNPTINLDNPRFKNLEAANE
ncbi:MAG TPA: ATP-binding cassette domain-containing protein [Opitutaceae bacterium]